MNRDGKNKTKRLKCETFHIIIKEEYNKEKAVFRLFAALPVTM